MKSAELAAWFNSLPVDAAETIKLEFAIAIDAAIKNKNMTRKQVAEAIKTSPAWVTKVLRGDVNLTIESMAKLCQAIDHKLEIKVARSLPLPQSNVISHSDFLSRNSACVKTRGAFEFEMFSGSSGMLICNDNEYANAA